MGSVKIRVANPVAQHFGSGADEITGRLETLEGKTLGLLWNGKVNGDVALRRAAELLSDRYPTMRVKFYAGKFPSPPELVKQAGEECDVVVGGPGDCGSCTLWSTHDLIQIERMGVPTAIIAARGFERDIQASARAFAMPDMRFSLVPKVCNNLTAEEATAQVDPIIDDLLANLVVGEDRAVGAEEWLADHEYEGDDHDAAWASFNTDFLERDLGDGYPLLPPTLAAVDALLAEAGVDPAEEIAIVPPGNGRATYRNVAVNCVMAGATAPDLVVVTAALRALANKEPSCRSALVSTSAHAPLFLINGPIAEQLGINGGQGCLGPGKANKVNLRIGRAILLCLKNLGGWYPGVLDMDSIGSTRKSIVVVAENETESPWEPYHVTQGFDASDSTVTLFFTCGESDIAFQGHVDSDQLARAIASFSGGTHSLGYFTSHTRREQLGRLLFLTPPHAIPLAEGGFAKAGLEQFMYENGKEPVSRLIEPAMRLHLDGEIKEEWKYLFDMDKETAATTYLPVLESPDLYKIVVVGSVRGKDLLMPLRVRPHTEKIQ